MNLLALHFYVHRVFFLLKIPIAKKVAQMLLFELLSTNLIAFTTIPS